VPTHLRILQIPLGPIPGSIVIPTNYLYPTPPSRIDTLVVRTQCSLTGEIVEVQELRFWYEYTEPAASTARVQVGLG
jgi:hypothetical protein